MMWLRGISSSGDIKVTPVLYSTPGTFQVVNFNSSIKTNIQSIDINSKLSLSTYISYNKGRVDEPTTWKSLDPAIASVNSEGVVTGVANGYAIITAENEESKDAVVIYVTDKIGNGESTNPDVSPSASTNTGITVERDGNDIIIKQEGTTTKTATSQPSTQTEKDPTTADGKYPATGKISLIIIFAGLVFLAGYVIVQNFKMRDIK